MKTTEFRDLQFLHRWIDPPIGWTNPHCFGAAAMQTGLLVQMGWLNGVQSSTVDQSSSVLDRSSTVDQSTLVLDRSMLGKIIQKHAKVHFFLSRHLHKALKNTIDPYLLK